MWETSILEYLIRISSLKRYANQIYFCLLIGKNEQPYGFIRKDGNSSRNCVQDFVMLFYSRLNVGFSYQINLLLYSFKCIWRICQINLSEH
jgi:hypothetical protein